MNVNNLICALLIFCVCGEALRFPGSVDGRIRRCLIAGLKRLHTNSVPLVRNIPILNDSEDSSILSNYPVELQQVFLDNIDLKSIKKLSQCSKQAGLLSDSTIAQRLASFNPHFAFDDELVNSLLLAILDKHFPNSKNLQSETIHDELQLLILKYTRDDLNFDSIPRNIYFYLISFMNEAVHGADAIFDRSIQHFCIILLKFKIPESCSYFRRYISRYSADHLDFFSLNPSKEEVRRYFEIPADINDWVKPRELHNVFYRALIELFYDDFTDDNVVRFYHDFNTRNFVYLKAFNRRYFSLVDNDELMRAYKDPFSSNSSLAIICNELSVRFGITIDTCYFSTRNSLNELSLDGLASFDWLLIRGHLPRYESEIQIYDLELIMNVMNSDLISPKLRSEILTDFVIMNSYDIIMILIKETIQPFNFIKYCGCNMYTSLTCFSKLSPINIFLEYADSINDPLICLMILGSNFPPEAKNIIHQKDLNLNKVYRIDLKLGFKLCQFAGRTMHFKQILIELNDSELNEAFNLDANDLNHDYSTIDESLPIVIVDKDYTFTPKSH